LRALTNAWRFLEPQRFASEDGAHALQHHAGDGRFAIKLRIPAWSIGATVRVNGKTANAAPGALATVTWSWRAGDTIDLVVPQPLRTLPIDAENPKLAAVMRGAVMYVGLNPWDGIGDQPITLPGSWRRYPHRDSRTGP
jgi:DUF1680 family protein